MAILGEIRKLEKNGRIIIPPGIRKHLSLREGMQFNVFIDDNDRIIIEKFNTEKEKCITCGMIISKGEECPRCKKKYPSVIGGLRHG